ncbi:MAG: M56 family metallopeptidase [Pirellulales bacterium]
MSDVLATLTDAKLASVAWTHFWQVTVVAALALLVVRMFCRQRPYVAYALLMLVLVKCLVPPLWSSRTSVFSWLQTARVATTPVSVTPLDPTSYEASYVDFAQPLGEPLPPSDPPPLSPTPQKTSAPPSFELPSWPTLLFGVWAVGAIGCVIVIVVGWCRQYRAIRRRCNAASGDVVELADRLGNQLRLRRRPRLWISHSAEGEPAYGPLCFGVLRPTVVLPDTFVEKSFVEAGNTDGLIPILAHELVHLKRGDTWAALLQVVVTVLWWFHPLVWLTSRQLSRQREKCCDQAVLASIGCSAEQYAQGVLNVLRLAKNLQPLYLASGIRPVDVTGQRLEAIMSPGTRLRRRTPWFCWVVLVVGAMLLLPGRGFVHGADDEAALAIAASSLQRDRAQETSSNWLKLIGVALHSYHSEHGHFPAAASCDADGNPLLSWRVHLLPYLEREDLYNRFHLDEPWDSPHNRELIAEMPVVFRSPNTHSEPGKTTYLALVGEDAVFGIQQNGPDQPTVYREGSSDREIEDGTSATAMLVEAPDTLAVDWTRPRDFRIATKHPSKGLFAPGEEYSLVLFADGSRHLISNTIGDQLMLAICSKDGHEVVDMSSIKSAQRFNSSDAQYSHREKKPAMEVSLANLKRIGLAMHNYHDTFQVFPANTSDDDGKPLLSWRVHLLPFLDRADIYDRFHLDEPWDSPHNRELIAEMPDTYRSPTAPASTDKTVYLGVVDDHSIFSTPGGTKMRQITDGTSNTVMVVTASDDRAVEWTRPIDCEFDAQQPSSGLVTPDGEGTRVLFADGSVRLLPADIGSDALQAAIQHGPTRLRRLGHYECH